jgi:hypothetical protein
VVEPPAVFLFERPGSDLFFGELLERHKEAELRPDRAGLGPSGSSRISTARLCGVQTVRGVVENPIVIPGESKGGDLPGRDAAFATTHWSVVQAPGRGESPQAADALEKLCRAYW